MAIQLNATVLSVHGEGDKETVNRYAAHEAWLKASNDGKLLRPLPTISVDAGEILVLLRVQREDGRELRVELPLYTWEEIEAFKALPGVWDAERKQFLSGASVPVSVG